MLAIGELGTSLFAPGEQLLASLRMGASQKVGVFRCTGRGSYLSSRTCGSQRGICHIHGSQPIG